MLKRSFVLLLSVLCLAGCGGGERGPDGLGPGGASGIGGSDASGGSASGGASSGGTLSGSGGSKNGSGGESSEPDCDDGETRTVSCGTNGNGFQDQVCVEEEWVEDGDCDNRFVSRWQTDVASAENEITLPLVENGTYDFTVDWGDGTTDPITAWDDPARTHTYDEPGVYTVTIEGTIRGWAFAGSSEAPKLLDIERFGPLELGDTSRQFQGTTSLDVLTAEDAPGLSHTTSLELAFMDSGLRKAPSLRHWDVSGVTDMYAMFQGATSFNQPIGDWCSRAGLKVAPRADPLTRRDGFAKDAGSMVVVEIWAEISDFR